MPQTDADRLAHADAWLAQDPDAETRAELSALIELARSGDSVATADLADRFDSRLAFGTAGLRGPIEAGPNRMNRVLVSQAAAGLAAYLLEQNPVTGATGDEATDSGESLLSVVVGYDGRKNSEVFARDTAEIMAGAGVRAVLLPRLLPTPVLAFAVRHFDASAGVMVTASHNPPHDNGYKVYLGGDSHGSQIVSPVDAEIAAHIDRIAETTVVPELRRGEFTRADDTVVDAYVVATASVAEAADAAPQPASSAKHPGGSAEHPGGSAEYPGGGAEHPDGSTANPGGSARHPGGTVREHGVGGHTRPLSVVYTALHGVGWQTTQRVFEAAGLPLPELVTAQIEPDATFPTVSFPNPEEPGAMDLAFETARESNADLIIANDPDADRLAIAIPDASCDAGYRRLAGNEIGLVLGWRACREASGSTSGNAPSGSLACSIVSSPGLGVIAEAYGLDFHATLTGFKWISRAPGMIYGYEEALGYLVNPETVRDKDGISAAVAMLTLAGDLHAQGRTLADHLDDLVATFGCFESGQISIRVDDLSRIGTIMSRLRSEPPADVGGVRIERIDDFADGFNNLPPSDVLQFTVQGGSRIMVRPSGTEPKLKIYIDARATDGDVSERRAAATATVAALEAGMRDLVG